MLNEEKIKLMTKLAIYEQNEGREDLPLCKYYKSDYLTLKMINSSIAMTVGYLILLLLIAVINAEELLAELVTMDVKAVGIKILVVYLVLFVINMVGTYFVYRHRFLKSRENLNRYNNTLKELYTIYKREEKMASSNFFKDDFRMENLDADIENVAEFGGIKDDEATYD